MKKTLSLIFAVAALSVSSFAATITNGDFESGNTGFTTAYTFVGTPGPSAMFAEGTYTVTNTGETSNSYHAFWSPGVSPFGGARMALFNGLTGQGDEWIGEATGLVVGNTYRVSGFGASVFNQNPANLQWFMGNTAIGTGVSLPGGLGVWTEFTGTFTATATTQQLIIRSTQTAAQGNDFALDSLTIADTGIPEPSTYALFAAGLVGLAAIRRRK